MKELSIEGKAKAYDELIKRLNKAREDVGGYTFKSVYDEVMSELAESEDEKFLRYLIDCCKDTIESDDKGLELSMVTTKRLFAWLEKQGEQKPIDTKNLETAISNMLKVYSHIILHRSLTQDELNETDVYAAENTKNLLCFLEQKPAFKMITPEESLGIDSDTYNKIVDDCLWGEQKSADKVEPKFRIEAGKWYICISQYCNCIEGRCYQALHDGRIIDDFRTEYDMHSDAYKYFRLWTIQDAKEGDVLYLQKDGKEHIIIYKGVIKERFRTFVSAYCAYNGIVDAFCFADVSRYVDIAYRGIMPATKEQRDILFKKMKEAGYEWDADKKELKKIEQKSTPMSLDEAIEHCKEKSCGNNACALEHKQLEKWLIELKELKEQKSAWSEEDDEMLDSIIEEVRYTGDFPDYPTKEEDELYDECLAKVEWLQSIKDRVQPQPKQEWSEEDEGLRKEIVNYLECQKEDEPTRKEKINSWISWILKHSFSEWTKEEKEAWNKRLDCVINILDWAEEKGRISLSDCQDYSIMLKSLRPQSTWKPCDYELEVLKLAAEKDGTCLMGLYEQLKKLREEVKND